MRQAAESARRACSALEPSQRHTVKPESAVTANTSPGRAGATEARSSVTSAWDVALATSVA
jgi:hypothetical protein